jgi:hypothetical protein
MPTPPTPNMGLILPTLQDDEGVWDDLLNAALGVGGIDDHDHSAGRGVKVKPTGLDINADLTFAGHRALNLAATQLTAVDPATMAGFNRSFFVSNADNELYYRNNAGTNVKFTNGGTLNFSIVGGIGGDYTAVGALFSFDDGTDRYLAQQQGSPRPWAGMAVGNLDLYQQAASIVNRVRLKSPAALAASYDVTFPAALPGSTLALQMSAAGAITASNTFANPVVCAGTLGVGGTFSTGLGQLADIKGTLQVGQAATLLSTLAVAGVATFAAQSVFSLGAQFANNQNLLLQGTGYVQHGDRHVTVPVVYPNFVTASGVINNNGTNLGAALAVSSSGYFPIGACLPVGARIKSVVARLGNAPGAAIQYDFYFGQASVGAFSWSLLGGSTSSASNTPTITPSGPYTGGIMPAAADALFIRVTTPGGSTAVVCAWDITYDMP